ncbi:MAG: cation-translocating P-type ATPase, partial [Candidatus Aenigmatarchaeota archaeon]
MIAVIVSAFLGEMIDAVVIFIIILLNAVLGTVQERKAEHALEALKQSSMSKIEVVRNGENSIISSSELVPGDVVILRAGDRVSADMRILSQNSLRLDESLLTGESLPVSKIDGFIKDCSVADRKNMLFSGTTVVHGRCRAVVVSTGMETELGVIAAELQKPDEKAPLQKTLDKLGMNLGIVFISLSVIVFIIGILGGVDFGTMLLLSIALAVAAVPEGLPATITIGFALGVERMAGKNAIIRKLSSVETLGCTSVICSDKTGTLTMNQMTVKNLYIDDRTIGVTGHGYDTVGKFIENEKEISPKKHNEIHLLLASGVLCNDAELDKKIGDPTELALLVSARKAGVEDLRKQYNRADEIAFDSNRKMMSVVYDIGKKRIMYTKGAIESVARKCSYIYTAGRVRKIDSHDIKQIVAANTRFTKNGMRVLAFAMKKFKNNQDIKEADLIFIGLQAMVDPPRPEAVDSIKACKEAGIRVVMITGDHRDTAAFIATAVGIDAQTVLTGAELDKLTDDELDKLIETVSVYARVSPFHKVRLTDCLRQRGNVVAMTGDGINDAAALKKADIGIALGSGTEVAKEASDMILADDNFVSIVGAVREGRGIYNNIRKTLAYLLSGNAAEIMIIFFAVLLGSLFGLPLPIPLLAVQILWINLVTDGIPALALASDDIENDVMKQSPRNRNDNIFKGLKKYIIGFPIIMTICMLGLFIWSLGLDPANISRAQTLVFTGIVVFEVFAVLSVRNLNGPIGRKIFENGKLMAAIAVSMILQLIIIYSPMANQIFYTTPL